MDNEELKSHHSNSGSLKEIRKDLIEIINIFREQGQDFEHLPDELFDLIKRASIGQLGFCTLNQELLKFLSFFIESNSKCFDPWCFPGSFSALSVGGEWSGSNIGQDDLNDWQKLTGGKRHSHGDATYDIVTGFLPFNLKIDNSRFKNYFSQFLSEVTNVIHEKSKIFVTCTYSELQQYIKQHSEDDGLVIKAVLTLPPYTWANTNMESFLLWIEKGTKSDFYVGELSNQNGRARAIYNSINKGGNKSVLYGSLISKDRLGITCDQLQKEQVLERFSKKNGWPIRKLLDLSIEGGDNNLAFRHHPISSTLKTEHPTNITVGYTDVQERSQIKSFRSYTTYSIDESKLSLEFVKNYLDNSSMSLIGLNRKEFSLAIPELSEQKLIAENMSKLYSLESTIQETKRALLNPNKKLETITRRISNYTSHESLSFWISSLPFPISSILRIYFSENRADKKVEALLYFFEALTQFLAIATVSMLSSHSSTLESFKPYWVEPEEGRKDWYKRASFGDWIALGSRLRKAISGQFKLDKDGNNKHLESLGHPSSSFIDLVSNKELYKLLESTKDYRNRWKGHGGKTSDDENKDRAKRLLRILEKIRAISQGGLQEIEVLKSVSSNYKKGIHTSTVECLIGNETPFGKIKVESDSPLDEEELYLRIGNRNSPYLLLPFMRYNPENKAVYYYSRFIDEAETHWVTYNFAEASSMDLEMDKSFNEALSKFIST